MLPNAHEVRPQKPLSMTSSYVKYKWVSGLTHLRLFTFVALVIPMAFLISWRSNMFFSSDTLNTLMTLSLDSSFRDREGKGCSESYPPAALLFPFPRPSFFARFAGGASSSNPLIPNPFGLRRDVCGRSLRRSWLCEDGDKGTTSEVAWCMRRVPSEATSSSSLSLSSLFRFAINSCNRLSFAARFCAYD